MFAGWNAGQEQFEDFGPPPFVRAFGWTEPILVRLTENAAGPYWGWLDRDRTAPIMVYRREPLFRVCFPYRPEEEEAAGRGRIVHLTVERVS